MFRRVFIILNFVAVLYCACSQLHYISFTCISDINDFPGEILNKNYLFTDESGRKWFVFASDYLGFSEFWLSYTYDEKNWFPPIYTGVPAYIGYCDLGFCEPFSISFNINAYSHPSNLKYIRVAPHMDADSLCFPIDYLCRDTDMDGLTDLAEKVLCTNPACNDTDNDGMADGYDQNPLAAPVGNLLIHEKLHKYVVQQALKHFQSSQLVLVQQLDDRPMDYKRKSGYVLSLPSSGINLYLEQQGYGVPIISAAVTDTLKKYKINFEFYISPDEACGYEALFDYNKNKKGWVIEKIYQKWSAVAEEKFFKGERPFPTIEDFYLE